MLDFPASPTVGQVFDKWTWDGATWNLTPTSQTGGGGGSGFTYVTDAAPPATKAGDTWFDTSTAASGGTSWVAVEEAPGGELVWVQFAPGVGSSAAALKSQFTYYDTGTMNFPNAGWFNIGWITPPTQAYPTRLTVWGTILFGFAPVNGSATFDILRVAPNTPSWGTPSLPMPAATWGTTAIITSWDVAANGDPSFVPRINAANAGMYAGMQGVYSVERIG